VSSIKINNRYPSPSSDPFATTKLYLSPQWTVFLFLSSASSAALVCSMCQSSIALCLTVNRPKPLPLQNRGPYHWLRQRHCPRSTWPAMQQDTLYSNQELDRLLARLSFLRMLCNWNRQEVWNTRRAARNDFLFADAYNTGCSQPRQISVAQSAMLYHSSVLLDITSS
jgi:hypothetical protein